MEIFIVEAVFIHTQHIINLKNMKEYAIFMTTAVLTCLIVYADLEFLLKKCHLVKITPKIVTQRKRLSINLQDTHGVQYALLMIQKTDVIFIGEKIAWKSFVKI